MRIRLQLNLAVLPAFILAAHAAAPQGPRITPAGDVTTVPMLFMDGRPVIKVAVNRRGLHRMVLDTGAALTIVNPGWVGGRTERTLVTVQIGGSIYDDLPAVSFRMPSNFPKGVLSAEAFPGKLVTLNFPVRTVALQRGSLPPADGRRIFQYDGDRPTVPIRMAGVEVRVRVDTGDPEGLTLPLRLSAQTPLASRLAAAGKGQIITTDGDSARVALFSAQVMGPIELGEYTFDTQTIRFSDQPAPWPGNVGDRILRTFKVTIDTKNRRLLFER